MLEWIDGARTSCPGKKEKLVNHLSLEVLNQAVELVQEKGENTKVGSRITLRRHRQGRSAEPECRKDHKVEVQRPDFLKGSQDVVLSPITWKPSVPLLSPIVKSNTRSKCKARMSQWSQGCRARGPLLEDTVELTENVQGEQQMVLELPLRYQCSGVAQWS